MDGGMEESDLHVPRKIKINQSHKNVNVLSRDNRLEDDLVII